MLTVDSILHETHDLLEQLARRMADEAQAEVERIETKVCKSYVELASLPLAPDWKTAVDLPIPVRYEYRCDVEAAADALRRLW
jgi:hypothetical protein